MAAPELISLEAPDTSMLLEQGDRHVCLQSSFPAIQISIFIGFALPFNAIDVCGTWSICLVPWFLLTSL